ncbi:unnamed protein product [Dicrocoelium dendriticum]|nr:unnamed protein product [Dicrocoelium dendriticum]
MQGLEYVNVPANGDREYRLSLFAYREGTVQVKLTFTNEDTKEYQYYELHLKFVRPDPVEVVRLRTPVRRPIAYTIHLNNPLKVPANFRLTTTVPEVQIPSQVQIPPNCSGSVTLEFVPLCVGTYNGRLDASCAELGVISYALELKGTPAANEPPVQFQASLGQRHVRTLRFINHAKVKTEFLAKLDNTEFQCDKSVTAAANLEVGMDVTYEPSAVGTASGFLTLSSSHGGDYVFPLKGVATEPQPQGPFTIRAGEMTHIWFRNVFNSTMLYSFQVREE